MQGGLALVFLLSGVWVAQAFWLDLDLELDTALTRGKGLAYSRNTGEYLRDSFRKEILTPSLDKIVKAIKIIQQNDRRNEGTLMAVTSIVVFALGYLAINIKCKRKKKMNSQSVMWTKKVPGSESTAETEDFKVRIASA